MPPGRASAASTPCTVSCLASTCWTQVCPRAQPEPFILWPDCSSDHVTKLAHHGLPGPTLAAARYLSTSAPVLTPCSCTPSWVWATFSAAAPTLLAPEPGAAAAAASTMPGTEPGSAPPPPRAAGAGGGPPPHEGPRFVPAFRGGGGANDRAGPAAPGRLGRRRGGGRRRSGGS